MARKIYGTTPEKEPEGKKVHLAKILSVSERFVRDWLSRMDKDAKEARNRRIFEMWLACWTLIRNSLKTRENHRESVDCSDRTVDLFQNGEPSETEQTDEDDDVAFRPTKEQLAAADHATDFQTPLYNVWKQQEKTSGSSHFGNSDSRWVDNLLYLYTKPFDVVVDPFAGGGSTIDLCRKRLRRYWVSDRKPIVEREKEIRQHDLTDGLPPLPRWKDVRLVYLDPPYWLQAAGQYSNDPTDLANMQLEKFNEAFAGVIICSGPNSVSPFATPTRTVGGRRLPCGASAARSLDPPRHTRVLSTCGRRERLNAGWNRATSLAHFVRSPRERDLGSHWAAPHYRQRPRSAGDAEDAAAITALVGNLFNGEPCRPNSCQWVVPPKICLIRSLGRPTSDCPPEVIIIHMQLRERASSRCSAKGGASPSAGFVPVRHTPATLRSGLRFTNCLSWVVNC